MATAADLRTRARARLGGTDGNEVLTAATGAVLALLLVAEGVTILDVRGLLTAHMFIGMLLLGPLALKLASTGYRFARYYTGSRPYREKGPPQTALRMLAPVLVLATLGVFASGVALLAAGHRGDTLLMLHKASFIVWGAVFAVHFLAYLPRVLGSLRFDWTAARRHALPGTQLRVLAVAAALGGGAVLAVAVLPLITGWHGEHPH